MLARQVDQFNEQTLPLTYFVCDIETTGVSRTNDEILQFGWLFCRDGEVVTHGSAYVAHDDDVLHAYENCDYVTKRKAEGNDGYVKAADVRKYGMAKNEVFRLFREMYQTAFLCPEVTCVGHNIVSFDIPFIEYHLNKSGIELKFERDKIIDTGMLYKGWKANMFPLQCESLYDYWRRVSASRIAGLKWNLVEAAQTLGVDVDATQAHGSGYDCQLTSELYQLQRKLLLGE